MTRRMVAGGLAVVLVVGLGFAAYSGWWRGGSAAPASPAPDPATQKREEAAKYMASESFAKLDDGAKQEYFDGLRKASDGSRGLGLRGRDVGLSKAERERLRENVGPLRRRAMEKEMNTYFELPAEKKVAYLDEMLDRMQAGRAEREARRKREQADRLSAESSSSSRPKAEERPRQGRRRGPTLERMRNRIENTSAEERAKRAEFRKALRERAKERGVELGRGPQPNR